MIAEFKKREEKMQTELADKQQEIEKLKQENQALIIHQNPKTDRSEGGNKT